ncbi:uncharacterized protein LOC131641683 [Vicia villosa]|uniref:uncharacterized protein LOC131641683 n=1 Tax=Vicia villosa TaxID=3911 RepID=UPI00273C252E|nr:uncharacterized protein LOC131641683 [Vicia villosa]
MSEEDRVEWTIVLEDAFSVSSCYASFRYPLGPQNRNDEVLGLVWKMKVSFKIKAFGWRVFVYRLPTKDLLMYRGIVFPLDSLKCVLCGIQNENRDHSFLKCNGVKVIWRKIASWIGKPKGTKEDCLANFIDRYLFCKKKKVKVDKLGVVWVATSWIIWLLRDEMCFRNDI